MNDMIDQSVRFKSVNYSEITSIDYFLVGAEEEDDEGIKIGSENYCINFVHVHNLVHNILLSCPLFIIIFLNTTFRSISVNIIIYLFVCVVCSFYLTF